MPTSFSQIWSDPVFSKVIANFIWVVLAGLALLVVGRKKPGEYDFFKIICIKLPSWYLLVGINIFFIAISIFPSRGTLITLLLLTVILAISIWHYRSGSIDDAESDNKDAEIEDKTLIYRSRDALDHSIEPSMEKNYVNGTPVGEKGAGTIDFGEDRIFNIKRTNTDGRAVVHIKRYLGRNLYRVEKDLERSEKRAIQVVFEAKVSAGTHKLWFVAKHAGKPDWIHQGNKTIEITTAYWQKYRLHFFVPADEDFTLHFEDRENTVASSSIQIKNLEIYEPKE